MSKRSLGYAISDASRVDEMNSVHIVRARHLVLGVVSCQIIESPASKDQADALVLDRLLKRFAITCL